MHTYHTMVKVATIIAVAPVVFACDFLWAEPKVAGEEDRPAFTRPCPIVMVPTTADSEHRRLADEVAKLIGVAQVQESLANPVCCIWLEITRYTPNPGDAGYWIINQPGGSIISTSTIDQLSAAVDRFKKSARQRDGHTEVPVGLMTSYPVVAK